MATRTIKRHKKLVGLDIVHVYRMPKNPVDLPEYRLVTDELDDTARPTPAMQDIELDLEGIGAVGTHVVEVADLAPPLARPSRGERICGTFAMVGRGLPYAVGRRRTALAPAG